MAEEPANREKTGRFKKGVSGNPNGRPSIPQEFKELAEKYSVPALEATIKIMNDIEAKHSDRLKAIELIMDRGIGKATQPIDTHITGEIEIVVVVDDD